MNYKALIEKRAMLSSEINELSSSGKMTPELRSKMDELKEVRKNIEVMDSNTLSMNSETRSVKQMNKNTKEYRELDNFLRNEESGEFEIRSTVNELGATPEGHALVPTYVANEILRIMRNTSPITSLVNVINSKKGEYKIPIEGDNSKVEARFLKENESTSDLEMNLDMAKLRVIRLATSATITNEMRSNTSIDLVDYTNNKIGESLGLALEKSILTPVAGGPKSLADAENAQVIDIDLDNLTFDDILDLTMTPVGTNSSNASFVVSPRVYKAIGTLKDADGTSLSVNKAIVSVDGGLQLQDGTMIYKTDTLVDAPEGKEIFYGDFSRAYTVLTDGTATLENHANDFELSSKGLIGITGAAMIDGAVIDTKSYVVGKVK